MKLHTKVSVNMLDDVTDLDTTAAAGAVLVRRRDALANRVALVDAGLVALARDPEASLEAVAREAGLSRRTVYGHFSSRDDLVTAVAAVAQERLTAALDGLDLTGDDSATALARFELAVWRAAEPFGFLVVLAGRREYRDLAAERLGPLRSRRADLIRAGQTEGVFRSDVDADVLSRLAGRVVAGVHDEVLAGAVATDDAARLVAGSVLAVVGVAPAKAARCVEAAGRTQP